MTENKPAGEVSGAQGNERQQERQGALESGQFLPPQVKILNESFKPPIHFIGLAELEPMRQDFGDRLITQGLKRDGSVFYTHNNQSIINLAGLQRLNLHALQKDLVDLVGNLIRTEIVRPDQMAYLNNKMSAYGKFMGEVVNTLHPALGCRLSVLEITNKICQITVSALRDWDFMVECKKRAADEDQRDPFILTTTKTLDLCLMKDAGLISTNMKFGEVPSDADLPDLPGFGRGSFNQYVETESAWKRFYTAILGSLALLAPMLLMVLHHDQTTSLATVCVSVVLFALAAAFFLKESLATVVSIVAAYTAVLIVFVGTTS
jgi:hypothetical protein